MPRLDQIQDQESARSEESRGQVVYPWCDRPRISS